MRIDLSIFQFHSRGEAAKLHFSSTAPGPLEIHAENGGLIGRMA
jgi:hypothetical protein